MEKKQALQRKANALYDVITCKVGKENIAELQEYSVFFG